MPGYRKAQFPMANNDFLLEARAIGRRLPGGDGWLLRDISLGVRPGERIAITGASSSGKTLLLRSLALLDSVDAGEVYWQGQAVRNETVPDFRRQVMYLHQQPAMFEGNVEENLRMPYKLRTHHSRHFDRKRIASVLADLGRDRSFLAKSHRELSGGEAQIVALLRAVQLDPVVLLLDEPTAALDSEAARSVEQLVDRWLREADGLRALVWVSHNEAQTGRVTGRRIYIHKGQIDKEERT
jgi:putative ABC transport system ATP-binding protein